MTGSLELFAVCRGAPVLPHNGVGDVTCVTAIEGDRGLALIGDAERDDLVTSLARAGGDLAQRLDGQPGDLDGVVLDLAGVGEVLGQFAIGGVDDPRALVVGDRSHPRGPGVEGENEFHRRQDNDGCVADCG